MTKVSRKTERDSFVRILLSVHFLVIMKHFPQTEVSHVISLQFNNFRIKCLESGIKDTKWNSVPLHPIFRNINPCTICLHSKRTKISEVYVIFALILRKTDFEKLRHLFWRKKQLRTRAGDFVFPTCTFVFLASYTPSCPRLFFCKYSEAASNTFLTTTVTTTMSGKNPLTWQ